MADIRTLDFMHRITSHLSEAVWPALGNVACLAVVATARQQDLDA